ncbi:AMP-binding protein [Virgibacillus halophilus]|uniref:AMP-binding protein n=1 Tax=Tigheibacillus halophilus TaxID=361280 RepID=A0ABU5C3A1_9BACI|nr:AMP-binding protein [Virgibacillus halophilus]
MDLGRIFESSVSRFPENIAIVDEDRRYTYREFDSEINKLAVSMQKLGIEKGDRVVIILKNRLETVAFYWAIQKIGAVFTPINFRLSSEEVSYCVDNAEAKAVVYEPTSEDAAVNGSFTDNPILISVLGARGGDTTYKKMLKQENEDYHIPNIDINDICLMLYTSGTTGKPKGVPRTHLNEYSAATAHIIQNRYSTHESTIGAMPLYHTMGMRSLVSMGLLNGKLVMTPDYSIENTLEILERERITCVYLIPTIFHDLVHNKDFNKRNLRNLKKNWICWCCYDN